jgi:hypothetical protein
MCVWWYWVVYVVVVRVVVEVWLVGEGGCRVLGYSVGRWRRHLGGRPECCVVPEATGYEVVLVGVIVGVRG